MKVLLYGPVFDIHLHILKWAWFCIESGTFVVIIVDPKVVAQSEGREG